MIKLSPLGVLGNLGQNFLDYTKDFLKNRLGIHSTIGFYIFMSIFAILLIGLLGNPVTGPALLGGIVTAAVMTAIISATLIGADYLFAAITRNAILPPNLFRLQDTPDSQKKSWFVKTADNAQLQTWAYHGSDVIGLEQLKTLIQENKKVVLCFNPQGGEILAHGILNQEKPPVLKLCFNYRGRGSSSGTFLSLDDLGQDGLAQIKFLLTRVRDYLAQI